jgi:hypothetical protein
LYSSPSIIKIIKSRRMRWAGHVARMRVTRNAYKILVGTPQGKRPLGRPGRRWEDNIKLGQPYGPSQPVTGIAVPFLLLP